VTPHCSQIQEIIILFKNASDIYKNLQNLFGKAFSNEKEGNFEAVVIQKIQETLGLDESLVMKMFLKQKELLELNSINPKIEN
jgi:hypothetical protein